MNTDELWPEGAINDRMAWHTLRRLHRRYRLVLEPYEYSAILCQIKRKELLPLLHHGNKKVGVFKYSFHRNGHTVRVYLVGLLDGSNIITALSPQWIPKQEQPKRRPSKQAALIQIRQEENAETDA